MAKRRFALPSDGALTFVLGLVSMQRVDAAPGPNTLLLRVAHPLDRIVLHGARVRRHRGRKIRMSHLFFDMSHKLAGARILLPETWATSCASFPSFNWKIQNLIKSKYHTLRVSL